MNTYFTTELVRPWKLLVLAWGISALWYGMKTEAAPDWTWATILWMSLSCHLLMPWAVDTFMRLRWKLMPLAILATWWAVDGSWMVGVLTGDNTDAAWSMRSGQWLASLCLALLFGVIFRPKASLLDMLRATSTALGFRGRA